MTRRSRRLMWDVARLPGVRVSLPVGISLPIFLRRRCQRALALPCKTIRCPGSARASFRRLGRKDRESHPVGQVRSLFSPSHHYFYFFFSTFFRFHFFLSSFGEIARNLMMHHAAYRMGKDRFHFFFSFFQNVTT